MRTGVYDTTLARHRQAPALGRRWRSCRSQRCFRRTGDFDATHFLYLAATSTYPDGRRTVGVVRVREVQGRLGEVATIVPEVPLSSPGNPAISVGRDGYLYLAVPGRASASAEDPHEAAILRYTDSGEAAGHARNGSPIWAQGLTEPSDLLWTEQDALVVWGRIRTRGRRGRGPGAADQRLADSGQAHHIPNRRPAVHAIDKTAAGLRLRHLVTTFREDAFRGRLLLSVGQLPRDVAVAG